MKKCPICQQTFTQYQLLKKSCLKSVGKLLETHFMDGKGVIRCPHCNARLIKKRSFWFIVALIPFCVSAVWYSITHQYDFLMYLSIVLFMIIYASLPYVPYDK